jgi:hypothetical protein
VVAVSDVAAEFGAGDLDLLLGWGAKGKKLNCFCNEERMRRTQMMRSRFRLYLFGTRDHLSLEQWECT